MEEYESVILADRNGPSHRVTKVKNYGTRKTRLVQGLYLVASVLWLALCYLLRLFHTNFIGLLILLIPLAVFAFGFISSSSLSIEVEDDMFKSNYLSVGLLVMFPLLIWCTNDYKGDIGKRAQFITIIIVALVLTMLSLIDIWVSKKWITLVKHVKSILQTSSLTLIIFALYHYYLERIST